MAKLPRATQKVFGENGGEPQFGQFGSLASGFPIYTKDISQIQALANYLDGWYAAVIGSNSPAIQDMNSLCYLFAYQLAYGFQAGVPEWDAGTTYYENSIVQSAGVLYFSLVDDNLNNAVSDVSKWDVLTAVKDGAITNPKLAANAVETANIANLNVTPEKLSTPLIYRIANDADTLIGCGIAVTPSAGAWTIRNKQPDGSTDLDADHPLMLAFRSTTVTTGGYTIRSLTASESLVLPSGATLGYTASGVKQVFIYEIFDGTNTELAVSSRYFNQSQLYNTTAIGTGSDSYGVLYSTNARTGCAIRLLAVAEQNDAAGTWGTVTLLAVAQQGKDYADYVWNLQYAFEATSSSGGLWGGAGSYALWVMEDEVYDQGGFYNAGTGQFVAPFAGIYEFGAMGTSANQDLETAGDGAFAFFFLNGGGYRQMWFDEVDDPNSARSWCAHGVIQVQMAQGDTMDCRGNQANDAATNRTANGSQNWFWGRLVDRY